MQDIFNWSAYFFCLALIWLIWKAVRGDFSPKEEKNRIRKKYHIT